MTPTFWLLWSGAVLTLALIAWLAHTGAALIEMLYVRWRSRRRILAGRAQKEAEIIDLARRRYELESSTRGLGGAYDGLQGGTGDPERTTD